MYQKGPESLRHGNKDWTDNFKVAINAFCNICCLPRWWCFFHLFVSTEVRFHADVRRRFTNRYSVRAGALASPGHQDAGWSVPSVDRGDWPECFISGAIRISLNGLFVQKSGPVSLAKILFLLNSDKCQYTYKFDEYSSKLEAHWLSSFHFSVINTCRGQHIPRNKGGLAFLLINNPFSEMWRLPFMSDDNLLLFPLARGCLL